MTLYIRVYQDYTYEIIFTEGRVKKKRIHLLINPKSNVILKGQSSSDQTEINIESLTHFVTLNTSTGNLTAIEKTVSLAELTNKPIITNSNTSSTFKDRGISIKQLRIMSGEEEVLDDLRINPVYLDEMTEIQVQKPSGLTSKIPYLGDLIPNSLNPLKWKPINAIKQVILVREKQGIDLSKPLGLFFLFGKYDSVLLPLEKMATEDINKLVGFYLPKITVFPYREISDTVAIAMGSKTVLIVNEKHSSEQVMHIPKTYNPSVKHDTIYGALEEWILLP
ncbi:MAG: hypothetical protein ACW98K_03545 [Candidatus Kariarchaeaceae archaeon]|jgi:hypothetical protein